MKQFTNSYDAGYDAAISGANTLNCHFRWFSTVKNKDEWERGNNEAKKLKSHIQDDVSILGDALFKIDNQVK